MHCGENLAERQTGMGTLWAQPLFGHEHLGGSGEGDVVMPAGAGPVGWSSARHRTVR